MTSQAELSTQAELYGLVVTIRPTGALTFRRLPSSILHISTYPFMPPTTMSGWLRRLYLLSGGNYPDIDVKQPKYYVMPRPYHVLGAYPLPDPRHSYQIHTTKRHGVRAFTHNAFSRLTGSRGKDEVYQLHTWEYLFVNQLRGFVMHPEPEALDALRHLQNLGAKCGKEGFAFLESVSDVRRFTLTTESAMPVAPATGQELIGRSADLFLIYRYEYIQQSSLSFDPAVPQPSHIAGFTPLWLGWPGDRIELNYWTDGEYHIPAGLVEVC